MTRGEAAQAFRLLLRYSIRRPPVRVYRVDTFSLDGIVKRMGIPREYSLTMIRCLVGPRWPLTVRIWYGDCPAAPGECTCAEGGEYRSRVCRVRYLGGENWCVEVAEPERPVPGG